MIIESIILRYENKRFYTKKHIQAFKDERALFIALNSTSNYGHKIIPFAKKFIDKSILSDFEIIWNDEYSVKTAETITSMVLGHSFNMLASHEMFYDSRYVSIHIFCPFFLSLTQVYVSKILIFMT